MIKNKQYRINKSEITPNTSLIDVIKQVVGKDAIRWYISQITSDEIIIQATLYSKQFAEIDESVEGQYYPGKTVVVNIIPTGIGCSIGGYAGDATPTANLLASTVDYLITNPNENCRFEEIELSSLFCLPSFLPKFRRTLFLSDYLS